MKKSILYIVLFFGLCFGIKAQAQIIKVISIEEKKEEGDWNLLFHVLFEPSSRLVFTKGEESLYVWPEKGVVKTIEIMDTQEFDKIILNPTYKEAVSNAQVLLINWSKGDHITLMPKDLIQLMNLKYVVIRSFDKLNENNVKEMFSDLLSSNTVLKEIEILYMTLEEPN